MISAALEALSQAASFSSTPNEESQLPNLLSQALNDFISGTSSMCATPPSTPLDQDVHNTYPVSANDLITALTSTLTAHCELNKSSDNLSGSGGAPSVPFGTPREGGGLSELSRLGIQPESLLAALNTLKNTKEDEQLLADGKKSGDPLVVEREEGQLFIEVPNSKMPVGGDELEAVENVDIVGNGGGKGEVGEEMSNGNGDSGNDCAEKVVLTDVPFKLEMLDTAVEQEQEGEEEDGEMIKNNIENGGQRAFEDEETRIDEVKNQRPEGDAELMAERERAGQQGQQQGSNNCSSSSNKELEEERETGVPPENAEWGQKVGDVLYPVEEQNSLYHIPSAEDGRPQEEEGQNTQPHGDCRPDEPAESITSLDMPSSRGPQRLSTDYDNRPRSEDVVEKYEETLSANEQGESSPKDTQKSQSPGMPTRYKVIDISVPIF